jgi:hypothetical protein
VAQTRAAALVALVVAVTTLVLNTLQIPEHMPKHLEALMMASSRSYSASSEYLQHGCTGVRTGSGVLCPFIDVVLTNNTGKTLVVGGIDVEIVGGLAEAAKKPREEAGALPPLEDTYCSTFVPSHLGTHLAVGRILFVRSVKHNEQDRFGLLLVPQAAERAGSLLDLWKGDLALRLTLVSPEGKPLVTRSVTVSCVWEEMGTGEGQ